VLNKYRLNRIIMTLAIAGLVFNFWGINNYHAPEFKIWAFISNLIFLNYLLNTVHQSSHFLLSKKYLNNRILGHIASIFSGFTWSHFLATHLEHHKHVGNEKLDPDYSIARSGQFFLIPFLIWKIDSQFFSLNLHKIRGYWKDYFFDRVIQILAVAVAIQLGYWNTVAYFWIIPLFWVGFLYGQYLFYWPHYSNRFELWARTKNFILLKAYVGTIDLSRIFHVMHHDKVNSNLAYFPLEIYLIQKLKNNWKEFVNKVDSKKYIIHKPI
jgi:fatty acid desaturase